MTQLIIGAACGYTTKDLEPFVKSLRRHYQGDAILVVFPLSDNDRNFFEQHNIITYELENTIPNPKDIQTDRYYFYKDCLQNFTTAEHILITDVRDVVFQDDPFKNPLTHQLEFYQEPCLYKNCSANLPWIYGIYAQPAIDLVQDKNILCSGTTMGTYEGINLYIDTMIAEFDRLRSSGRRINPGEDQPIHNFLAYSERFPNWTSHANATQSITTLHHQQQFTFNRAGQLLNDMNEPIPIVHQWDRTNAVKAVAERTALEGPLKY